MDGTSWSSFQLLQTPASHSTKSQDRDKHWSKSSQHTESFTTSQNEGQ